MAFVSCTAVNDFNFCLLLSFLRFKSEPFTLPMDLYNNRIRRLGPARPQLSDRRLKHVRDGVPSGSQDLFHRAACAAWCEPCAIAISNFRPTHPTAQQFRGACIPWTSWSEKSACSRAPIEQPLARSATRSMEPVNVQSGAPKSPLRLVEFFVFDHCLPRTSHSLSSSANASRRVFTVSRCSQVENADSPRNVWIFAKCLLKNAS